MAYSKDKDTSNPFLPKVAEKWEELTDFEGDSIVEIIVKSLSQFIVFLILVCLIPIGAIISIYNSFYNLQKKAYDDLMYDTDSSTSQFASSVEFGIYVLLSLPFLLVLIPYWIIAALVTWFAKHKVMAIIVIVLIVAALIFMEQIMMLIYKLF